MNYKCSHENNQYLQQQNLKKENKKQKTKPIKTNSEL